MPELRPVDPYHGVFMHTAVAGGGSQLSRHPEAPATLPDPDTGRALQIATVEVSGAICPACARKTQGGFISFVSDLRLVFACPNCRSMLWLDGA
ncbi:MAG: hypothetical protein A3H96_03810 [Acidobacteria bacterium RIFCSPLOWO2_02_FULL_67_36]|nr:MAG: hypothetical protein A3H96_03810 [Acidobacteria bacterium RIFCSPLOWO2_02_FULL_67_36]OFW21719.1 MAG: hypothetical protein A3G21_15115 [Acidobacteria bacterium RIFCSPLOWO2_12_FULL_66_21]